MASLQALFLITCEFEKKKLNDSRMKHSRISIFLKQTKPRNNIIDENCDSRSQVVVVDQLIAQPPQLFLLFVFIEMSRAAIASIPTALSRSTSLLGKSVVDSWRFWPISVYVLLRLLKKKKHFTGALNLCSIAWISHLAKYRSRKLGLHKVD